MNSLILLLMGRLLLLCGMLQILPLGYSLMHAETVSANALGISTLCSVATGLALMRLGQLARTEKLGIIEGAGFLLLSWLAMAAFGGVPYFIDGDLTLVNAFFDSISCFTTTGALDLPYQAAGGIVLWRSISQWLGGYMVLLLLSTVLPGISGCFGTDFLLAGSTRSSAITLKRIDGTAKRLMKIYTSVTVLGIVLYMISGLSPFDAINLGLVVISTGGCYELSAQIGAHGWVMVTVLLGVIAAGCNVLIYWQAIERKELRVLEKVLHNSETWIFAILVVGFTAVLGMHLYFRGFYSLTDAVSNALFQLVSFGSTTGVLAEQMYHWHDVDKFFLICMALIGGCIGSIAGGFKIFRLQVLIKSSMVELRRTIHPSMVSHIMIDGRMVPQKVIERILGYFFMFFGMLLVSVLVISLAGLNMQQTLDVALACVTSTGQLMLFHLEPGQIRALPDWTKLYCSLLMVVGKVNVFTFVLIVYKCCAKLREGQW